MSVKIKRRIVPYSWGPAADTLRNVRRPELMIEKDANFYAEEIILRPNYYDGFNQNNRGIDRVTVGKYLSSTDDGAFANTMCVEMPAPKLLSSRMKLRISRKEFSDVKCVGLLHAGRTGSIAPLHFDWDHRWVMHACLIGRKSVYLIPPEAGWLLHPIVNTSAICLPRLTEADRSDLLRRLGGTEVKLTAGEAVLFPSLWWHAVRYDAPSLSVSLRFGEQRGLRPFAVLPRSFWLQRLVWHLFREKKPLETHEVLIRSLTTFFHPSKNWVQRYMRMNTLYRELLLNAGQSRGAQYLMSDSFNSEIHIARKELQSLYCFGAQLGHQQTPETIEDVRSYLFEESGNVPYKTQRILAKYALAKRQGLQPQRGLIAVQLMRDGRNIRAPAYDNADV